MTIPGKDDSASDLTDSAENPFCEAERKPSGTSRAVRPTTATVLGVVYTIMGILATLSSVVALLNALFSAQIASVVGQGGPFQDAQAEMYEKMASVLAKYFVVNVLLSISGIVLGSVLAIGAVGMLAGYAWSRKLLLRTLLVLIVYEIIRAVVYGFTQFEIAPITQEYMEEVAGGSNASGGEFVAQIAAIMMVVGVVIWSGWTLIKLALMIWGRRYIASEKLDDYFAA
jgi:hypothetical protein